MTPPIKPGTSRALKERLKAGKHRTKSSRAWLERQLNDPYVRAAKTQGYRSRAAYKLSEMDDKFRFLKRGSTAVDLGAAPGGWTQVLVERCGAGNVVGADIQPMEPIEGASPTGSRPASTARLTLSFPTWRRPRRATARRITCA
jgi:23S rRNA (uridine2552-2'-O)-methyltransferase